MTNVDVQSALQDKAETLAKASSADSRSHQDSIERRSWLAGPLIVSALLIVGVIGGITYAASQVSVAGAIIAPGELRVITNKTSIQHPIGGRLEQILVENGQFVEKGQVLVRLESDQARLRLDALRAGQTNLQRTIQRLEAALQADLTVPPQEAEDQSLNRLSDLQDRDGIAIATRIQRIRTFNQADQADIAILRDLLKIERRSLELEQLQKQDLLANREDLQSLVDRELLPEQDLRRARLEERQAEIAMTQGERTIAEIEQSILTLEKNIAKRLSAKKTGQ